MIVDPLGQVINPREKYNTAPTALESRLPPEQKKNRERKEKDKHLGLTYLEGDQGVNFLPIP
jgi:hypothetical protein